MGGDPVPIAALVTETLERLGIPYAIGGSMASSLHGIPRLTNDVDIVADLRPAHVGPLVKALGDDFMIEETAVREAISRRGSFNVIHYEKVEKVDIFVMANEPWPRQQIARRQLGPIMGAEAGQRAYYASPEDTVLSKLLWHGLGRGISDHQWSDIITVLQVQGPRLDDGYLDRWAATLGLTEQLARAREDAGELRLS